MSSNDNAHANVVVKPAESWIEQEKEVVSGVQKILNDEKVDAVICVAGGWAGGNAATSGETFISNIVIVFIFRGTRFLLIFQYLLSIASSFLNLN